MLLGIDPLLTGELLSALDAMGHSDGICVADAHFPAARLGRRVLDLPGAGTPAVVRAVRSVLPLDDTDPLDLMQPADDGRLPVQDELVTAARLDPAEARMVERHAFYDLAARCFVVVRTGETRTYGNAIVRKGVVPAAREGA
ncbi:L-fucose mutarotase [Mumia flava]|uniref:L-fucose mutarotase n=1 Tax=Mumia flava TaxID=1348852 RepID=A0A0B2BEY0_9ACTN|nr:RbsD/FucU family protein [Mumia flava]PJJ53710.1 L-fucose mutarotase [Mumia flava]